MTQDEFRFDLNMAINKWKFIRGYVPQDTIVTFPVYEDDPSDLVWYGDYHAQWFTRLTIDATLLDENMPEEALAVTYLIGSNEDTYLCPYIDGALMLFVSDPGYYDATSTWKPRYYVSDLTHADEPAEADSVFFLGVATHEYGHVLGLEDHSGYDPEMIMSQYYPGDPNISVQPCELSFVRKAYRDAHPAVVVTSFIPVDSAGTRWVQWSALHESNGGAYVLQGASDWASTFSTVANVGISGAGFYRVSTGSEAVFRLWEIEADGDSLMHVSDSLRAYADLSPPPPDTASVDTLHVEQQVAFGPVYGSEVVATNYEWVCIVPDAWAAVVQPLANFWSSRGHPAGVVTLSSIGGSEGIQEYIEDHANDGLKYVLLAGDASDHDAWSTSAYWGAGWSRPAWSTQPAHDVIPMAEYVVENAEHRDVGMTAFTPYYGSDWKYGDVDGDGSPDVAVGRAPVQTATELTRFVQKTMNAVLWEHLSAYNGHVGLWTYARDGGGARGAYILAQTESLVARIPSQLTLRELRDTKAAPLSYSQREALAVAALNEGRGLIILNSSGASRYSYGLWLDMPSGFGWGRLAHAPSALPFVLGLTCDIADIDMTEDPSVSLLGLRLPPLSESGLLEADRGPWGVFGPSRGIYVSGAAELGEEFLRIAYEVGTVSGGEAARIAMENTLAEKPWLKDVARSFVYLGDPLVRLPRMKTPPPVSAIEGPTVVQAGHSGTWQARATGGNDLYEYAWYWRVNPESEWTSAGVTSSGYTRAMPSSDMQVRVVVTSNGESSDAISCVARAYSSTVPVVDVDGPASVIYYDYGTWSVDAAGGQCCGVYSYEWDIKPAGTTSWIPTGVRTSTYTRQMNMDGFKVRCRTYGRFDLPGIDSMVVENAGTGGGCPVLESHTELGWTTENTILGRSLTDTPALDAYRLKNRPVPRDGAIELRLRENGEEISTLDEVRLIAIDRAPGAHVFAIGGRVVLATRQPPLSVVSSRQGDVTPQFLGGSSSFVGEPGETLLVRFGDMPNRRFAAKQTWPGGGGGMIEDGDKDPPPTPRLSVRPLSAKDVDREVLSSTGLRLEVPDGSGSWRLLRHHYPRAGFDQAAFDSIGQGPLQVVFVGRHRVRAIDRLHIEGEVEGARKLSLLGARHSLHGDVSVALDSLGNVTASLAPGDTIQLTFEWPPIANGLVRDIFLMSRGVYTANLPAELEEVSPAAMRFALGTNRPNPFANTTVIEFELPVRTHVDLEVFDGQGRRVAVLASKTFEAGRGVVEWNRRTTAGGAAAPGIYVYRLRAGAFRDQRKMVVLP